MTDPVIVPLWLLVLLILIALPTLFTQVFIPLWLKVWKRWSQRAFNDVNPQLQLKLSPFTLTRYKALAAQLATDPMLLKGSRRGSRRTGYDARGRT